MPAKRILDQEYKKLKKKQSATSRVNLLNTIIQIKTSNKELENHSQTLYQDIREFIEDSILAAQTSEFRYDYIRLNRFKDLIQVMDLDWQIKLIEYYIRQLEQASFKDELKILYSLKYRILIKKALQNWKQPKNIIAIPIYFPLINTRNMVITFLIIGLFCMLVLLPAPHNSLMWLNYDLTYEKISSNFILNHSLNVISHILGIDSDFKLRAQNSISQLALIAGKIVASLYLGSILYNKLIEQLKK